MAGSVGTIFAEIDLDSSRYLKSQQKLLQDATTTSLSIEANFRNLGVKSSAEFDLMRQKITNSYEMIKNSSQATANDIVRAEQAKNNQLNSINEQQFGKQTSLMDKIKTNWFSIATTATAAYAVITQFAVPAIKAYMDQENAIVKMGMAMKNQGDFSADALKEMEDYSEQIQDTTTYADELTLSVMANLKSYGMTNDEVKKATRVAQDFTSAKKQEGMTITTASDLLGKAYVGNTGALGRYGVVIDQTLQGSEKFEAVMGQLEQRFGGSAQAELLTYSGQWEHLKNQWGDIQELLGFGLLKSIQALQVGAGLLAITFMSAGESLLKLFDFITIPITLILKQFAALADYAGMEDLAFGLRSVANATSEAKDSITATKEEVMGWTSKQYDALVATDSTTKSIEKMGMQGQKAGAIDKEAAAAAEKAAKDRERAIVELTKAIAKSQGEIDSRYMTAHEKELARIDREAEEWLKKTQDDVLVAEWKAGQIAIANQKQEDETFKMWRKASDDAEAAMMAEAEAGVKLTYENIKRGDERRKAETELYKDLRGYETENYNASLALIKQKEIDLRALGVSEVAIAAWAAEENRKIELKKTESSNSFFAGVKAGLEDITAKQTSWGKVGIDTVKSFSDNASRTMGSVFFDAYKWQLKSSTEYFTAFTDAIMKSFADALAKMIVEAALSKITMSFNATWTEGAGAVLGAVGKVLGYAADWYFESMVPNAAYGGLIGGLNTGADSYANDTVPAMLSPGEYVMPRSSVNQETVGALEYMRQTGQKPRGYADGGLVDFWGQETGWGGKQLKDWLIKDRQDMSAFPSVSSGGGGGGRPLTPAELAALVEANDRRNAIIAEAERQRAEMAEYNDSALQEAKRQAEYDRLKKAALAEANDRRNAIIAEAERQRAALAEYERNVIRQSAIQALPADATQAQTYDWESINALVAAEAAKFEALSEKALWEIIKATNQGSSAIYTYGMHSSPGTYDQMQPNTLDSILAQIKANAYQPITVLDRQRIATNENDLWRNYGTYYLDKSGKLQRVDAGMLHDDIGQDGGGFFGGIFGTVLSVLTGGISDAVIASTKILSGTTITDVLNVATGGFYSLFSGIAEGDILGGIKESLFAAKDNPIAQMADALGTSIGTVVQKVMNDVGLMSDADYQKNYEYTELIAHAVGSYFIGGAGKLAEGMTAADVIEEVAKEVAKKYALKTAMDIAGKAFLPNDQGGSLNVSFNGISGGEGLAASIKNFPGSVGGSFAFPAKNGLDYVPRDNFMIRAHEGEAVLTKEENKKRRNGKTGGNVLQFYFPKALVVDKRSVNELAELIYPRLNKLVAWGT